MKPLREAIYTSLGKSVTPLGSALKRSGLTPNHVTIAGVTISIVASLIVMTGNLLLAGVVWFLGSAMDLVDGAMARNEKLTSPYGSFLDSTTDRISDGTMFTGLVFYFAMIGETVNAAIAAFALMAGFLTSYSRAKAESLGVHCKGGLVTRGERVFVIGIGLLFDQMIPALYILVVLSTITVGQRIVEAKQQLDKPA